MKQLSPFVSLLLSGVWAGWKVCEEEDEVFTSQVLRQLSLAPWEGASGPYVHHTLLVGEPKEEEKLTENAFARVARNTTFPINLAHSYLILFVQMSTFCQRGVVFALYPPWHLLIWPTVFSWQRESACWGRELSGEPPSRCPHSPGYRLIVLPGVPRHRVNPNSTGSYWFPKRGVISEQLHWLDTQRAPLCNLMKDT